MILNFVGDLSLVGIDPDKFQVEEKVQQIFAEGDINIANLECPLTDSDTASNFETCHLKGKPEPNHILDMFHVFSLANNHILDFAEKGLNDTIEFLNQNNKKHFGADINEKSANEPLLMEQDDFKIALVGLTRWYNAKGNNYGTASDNIKTLKKQIKKLKAENYFIIAMPHWNYVHTNYPCPAERKRGQKLINAGVDLIVGAHPHVIQGYETYKNKYIYHSLGNFIFHTNSQFHKFTDKDIRNRETFILSIKLYKDYTYSSNVTFLYNDNHGVRMMELHEKEKTNQLFLELSNAFTNNKIVRRKFYESSKTIVEKSEKALKKANELSSSKLKLLFDRALRIRKQDILIKLYSYFN